MSYIVRGDGHNDYSLQENNTLESILQNVALIIATKRGTLPMYREFGIPMEFIDKPMPMAQTILTAEVVEGVDLFEPRAKVINVSFEYDKSVPGKIIPIVEVAEK